MRKLTCTECFSRTGPFWPGCIGPAKNPCHFCDACGGMAMEMTPRDVTIGKELKALAREREQRIAEGRATALDLDPFARLG